MVVSTHPSSYTDWRPRTIEGDEYGLALVMAEGAVVTSLNTEAHYRARDAFLQERGNPEAAVYYAHHAEMMKLKADHAKAAFYRLLGIPGWEV